MLRKALVMTVMAFVVTLAVRLPCTQQMFIRHRSRLRWPRQT